VKQALEVWPAALVSGASFAIMQYVASSSAIYLTTDVVSGVFSVICTALFLRFVWHPNTRFLLRSEREAAAKPDATGTTAAEWKYKYKLGETIHAGCRGSS